MERLVVDASVLTAALMADGRTRHPLLHPPGPLYVPPRIFVEIEANTAKIVKRARVPRPVAAAVVEDVRTRVQVVPAAMLAPFLGEARRRTATAGAWGDEDCVALALAMKAPVWTLDKDFRRIRGIRVVTTADLLEKEGHRASA